MMEHRHERYNADRAELFRAEAEGKVMVLAPESTMGVRRTERNTEKLRLLWGAGYETAAARMDEIRKWFQAP
jgi:predicted patatin/cPLA2 family phospholipase